MTYIYDLISYKKSFFKNQTPKSIVRKVIKNICLRRLFYWFYINIESEQKSILWKTHHFFLITLSSKVLLLEIKIFTP